MVVAAQLEVLAKANPEALDELVAKTWLITRGSVEEFKLYGLNKESLPEVMQFIAGNRSNLAAVFSSQNSMANHRAIYAVGSSLASFLQNSYPCGV